MIPAIEWYWAACERLGIPVAILAGAAVPLLVPIVERHPALRLVIDHSGMRGGSTLAEATGNIDTLASLARHPQVYMKMGSIPNASAERYPFADVHPYLRRIHQAFGAQRMLWESDFTQLGGRLYAECLRMWQEGVTFVNDDERDWILGRSAAAVLNWPEPSDR